MIDLNECCIGHWRLNDSGCVSCVIDSGVSNRDGQLVDSAGSATCDAHSVNGVTGTALCFDGIDDRIDLPCNEPQWLAQADFSVSMWIYFNKEYNVPYAHHEMLVQGNGHWSGTMSNRLGWTLHRDGEQEGRLKFYVVLADGSLVQLHSSSALASDKWWHVVAMREGNKCKIYVDCVLEGLTNCSGAAIDYDGNYDEDKVILGAFGSDSDYQYHFDGILDNVLFLNRGLSEDEIAWLWNNGQGIESLGSCTRTLVGGGLGSVTLVGKGVS